MNILEKSKSSLALTKNQTSIWLDEMLSEDKAIYTIGGWAEIKKDVNRTALQQALQKLVLETDVIGLSIHVEEGTPIQKITPPENCQLSFFDFSKEPTPEIACQNWMKAHFEIPFSLEQAPLFELALLKAGEGHFFLMMKVHHLVIDTWGVALLVQKLDQYYVHFATGTPLSDEQQVYLFQGYVPLENSYQHSEKHTNDRNYWVGKFERFPKPILEKQFYTDHTPAEKNKKKTWTIPDSIQLTIEEFATAHKISLAQIWVGILATYFYKVTGNENLCFGLPIANRDTEREKNTIGLLTGVVPLLVNASADLSFKELLFQIKNTRRSDRPHQRFSLPELMNELRHLPNASNSLFDISINFDNIICELDELDSEFIWSKRGAERKTPMTFFIKPFRADNKWELKVAFLPKYCSESAAEMMLQRIQVLLNSVMENPAQTLGEINILPDTEQQLVLKDFNNTNTSFPFRKNIVDLFEKQATKTPDNIAVVFGNKELTYQQLNEKANTIAQYFLQEYKIKPDDIIGLQVSRSEAIIVGILGILKAGAAYLPMGLDLPQARVAFMLEDSAAKLLLADQLGFETANNHNNIIPVLDLEQIIHENEAKYFQNPAVVLNPSNLAYIIYTSGSTGKPKGVMIEHRNVVRLMVNDRPLFDFKENDVWTLFHYYGFDFSVWEIWGALLFGGRVVVVPKEATLNPEIFANLLLEKKITVLNQVPSTFDQVQVHLLKKASDKIKLRYIIFGGAKLIPATLQEFKNRFPATRLINMYGITETTVHVTYKEIEQQEIQAGISNIGSPIPTLRCYILDENLNPVAIGTTGEIYIAGDGLARGYLNNPELTAARFIESPFEKGTRLYKSGDSGRWLENGDIEFFGRIDFQLKIRGFRIEAGEIEQKLLEFSAIQSAIVLGKTIKENTELVAYLSGKEEALPSLEFLRSYLGEALPAYMIPAYFVRLENFPLTKNGKVDRKALPEPDGLSISSSVDFVTPCNKTEVEIVAAFAEILGMETTAISTLDDFFNLGGDSIKLIRLVGIIYQKTGIKLAPAKVYASSQVMALAEYILENKKSLEADQSDFEKQKKELETQFNVLRDNFLTEEAQQNTATEIEDVFPMSDIQKGMVFGNLLYEKQGVYHDQAVYTIGHIGFEKKRFEKALELMVAKHANLRTAFRLDHNGEDLQVVYKKIKLPLTYRETQGFHQDELVREINTFLNIERRKGFDIENSPLWRMKIFQAESGQPLLVLQFHHGIFDGWSLASFNTELLKIFHQLKTEPTYQPEAFHIGYKDFVIREMITKRDESIQNFWQKELADYERVELFKEEQVDDEFEIALGKDYLKQLKSLAAKYDVSVKTLTLSAYLLLLDFLSYQSESVIGIISNNRLPVEGGDKLQGCFLNSVPLRVPVGKEAAAVDFIRKVKEKIKALRGKDQMTTMEIAKLSGESTVGGNPIFDVIFNYIDFHIYDDLDDIGIGTDNMLQADLAGVTSFFERTNTYFDLMVNTTGNSLSLKIQLSKKLKAGYSAKEVLYKYIDLLDTLKEKPNCKVREIPFLNDTERDQLLHTFNDTLVNYAPGKTVVDLFEIQAAKTPDRVALVFEETKITYKELEKRSRNLACYLQEKGVQTDTLVGLCMDRSIELVVSILGILRAGGAYVPLDPAYPKDRVVYMLEDGIVKGNKNGAAKIILTQEHLKPTVEDNIQGLEITLIALVADWNANEAIVNTNGKLINKPTPQDLIYVIFTSGSTGKPKGTLVKHQGFYNLMHWYISDYNFNENSKFLLVSSINFDLTQKNLYAPLVLGGSLHMSSAENYDLGAINKIIHTQEITNINCTPSIFYGFTDEAANHNFETLQSLEYVFLGGEPINLQKLDKWHNNSFNKAKLVNSYGPTECSDVVSAYVIENTRIQTIPIGKPICNTQLYVMDTAQNLVLPGIQGELCIGGKGLGRGYLNNPELTAQKFIPNPFHENELLYKTGDLARWLPDGNIEFLGRADHQLKIRGYRIEAGEIEEALLQHPAVESAIIVGKEIGGTKELIAYLVAEETKLPALEELRSHLSERLPNYMIPAYFVELETWPLTPSGKVNRRALPDPDENDLASTVTYVAPHTRTEAILVRIWESVLQRTAIGIYDNFFSLGGHSLRVIRLVSLIQQQFGVSFKLSEVFTYPTIAALATQISAKGQMTFAAIEPVEKQEHYALSNAQRRLWLMDQLEENQTVYNMPMALRLKGKLDVKALKVAFERLVNRHENLRTNIVITNGNPHQIIHTVGQFEMPVKQWESGQQETLPDYILNFAQRPFDLAKDALFRLELLQLHPEEHLLLFNMHHITFDGWSMQILLKEVKHFYEASINEVPVTLPAQRIQYKDYAIWQNTLLEENQLVEDLRNYWLRKLAPGEEGIPVLVLPADYSRPALQTYKGAILTKTLSKDLLKSLENLSQTSGATLFMTLTAFVKILLYRYSKQRDILVGIPSSGRVHADLEQQLGFYVNMLVLRDYLKEGMTFTDFLAGVKQTSMEAMEHELYPFDRIVEDLNLTRDMSRSPLFDVMVAYQNEDPTDLHFGKVAAGLEAIDWQTSKYDLSFGFTLGREGLAVDIEYNTAIYKTERIHRMFEHLTCLMESVLENVHQPIDSLNLIPKTERQLLLHDFNIIHADYNLNQTVTQMFETQVAKTPDNIAVVFEEKELTYRALNEAANKLAHHLRNVFHIKGDDIIALQVERSEWMMIGLLGIMKSGGAYLPLDPDAPENRTAYMLQDSGAKLLLTDQATYQKARESFGKTWPVVAIENALHENYNNLDTLINNRNLAYLIYTSGSTGQPKGVMLEHRGVVNMLYGQIAHLEVTAEDKTLQFAPYTFDASVGELYMGLCAGAMMVIASRETLLSTEKFGELMHKYKITIADVPPTYLSVLDEAALKNARLLITAGEAAISKDVKKYSSKLQYVNIYGPTETTVVVCSFKIPASYSLGQSVPIGRPVPNMEILVVDEQLQLVPIGVPGELVISGVGLARGYLNNKKLTAEKFVPHPFREGERLYRTGDLGRWLDDGNLEFVGRVDHQLKIRGYRIEAGEIEDSLLQHPAIKSCVVLGKNINGTKDLVAYLVFSSNKQSTPDVASLRNYLGESLPDYMIPAYFVELETLPLTSHDKVDRKALPEPDVSNMLAGADYVAPKREMEVLLAETWEAVLRRPAIGLHDNFFHIGGDSIKALQISGRLGTAGWSLSIKDLFSHPTIAQLAAKVTNKQQHYPQDLVSGVVPLTAIQQWFFENIKTDTHHFNQAFVLSAKQNLNVDFLQQSLEALVAQHDILRATYLEESGLPVQTIGENITVILQTVSIEKEEEEAAIIAHHANKAQTSFYLSQGQLFKAVLFQKTSGDELLLVIHHLVVDGVSWRILLEDLRSAYSQLEAGQATRLAPKTAPFSWWSEKINAYANSPAAFAHHAYWEAMLNREVSNIVTDYPEQSNKVGDSTQVQFQLNKVQTKALLQKTNRAYNTEINDILLCGLSRALHKTFGGNSYQITLEGHGREALFDMDVSRTVGWFTAAFPIVLDYEEAIENHLQNTKEHLHRIPDKGMSYAFLRYLNEASFSKAENSNISFNYLGAFSKGAEEELLTISDRDPGASISPAMDRDAELDVLGILLEDQLQISITYGASRMGKSKLKVLAKAYEKELAGLIAHCVKQNITQLTPCDFTACDLSLQQYQTFLETNQLSPDTIADIYTLSPLQEGMLFHKLMDADSAAYFNQVELYLSTALDIPHFINCWKQIVIANPPLRTSFFSEGLSTPLQVVHKTVEPNFVLRNIASHDLAEQENIIQAYIEKDRATGFDLKEKSLLRLALFQTDDAAFRLIISDHHITMDGWSQAILLQDLKRLYRKEVQSIKVKPYSPYIAWLKEQPEEDSKAFWKNYLKGYEEATVIPGLKNINSDAAIVSKTEVLKLSKTQTQALEQLAKSSQVSLNTVIQGIWAVVLGIYNQKEEVVFGMTTSGRTAPVENIETLSGLFINTIPLRIAWNETDSFTTLLGNIQQSALAAQEYEHYSLALIQALWEGQGELLDHMMAFENYPVSEKREVQAGDLNITGTSGYEPVHYGFGLVVGPGEELQVYLNYNEVVLPTNAVNRIKHHIATAINTVLANPKQLVSKINILPETEQHILLHEFNNTKADFPKGKTIVDLFEMQVAKTPDNIAVVFEDKRLTYRQLNERSNCIANTLIQNHQIQPDDIIGLQVGRSENMVVGILGILKSGAAYLPMAPDLPKARIAFMLEDSAAKLLLTDDEGFQISENYNNIISVLNLEEITTKHAAGYSENPDNNLNPSNLAYIIYTSGSTGKPKGVMIEHRNVVRLMVNDRSLFDFNEKDVWTLFHYYGFDFSVWEIWGALLFGGKLIVVPEQATLDPEAFAKLLLEKQVTVLNQVPSTFEQVQGFLLNKAKNSIKLRYIIFGGAKLLPVILSDWKKQFPATRLINMYGITETTVHVTYKEIGQEEIDAGISNIGKPIPTLQCHILNKALELVPTGVAGEIYVAGDGLARGYLNNPELTAARFIESPFAKGERLYKSGDSGRWLANGDLEFFGRIDFQLKIRGFRIEAGEIEQALLTHPAIHTCVVIGKQLNADTELVAYLVGNTKMELPDVATLRTFLGESLPAYMIPTYFIPMENMPLTVNGKINRKALPEPDAGELASGVAFLAPRNETEKQIVYAWEQVLERKDISVNDNFFHLGGHSLRAIRLLGEIQKHLQIQFPLQLLFQYPVLADQASQLDALREFKGDYSHQHGLRFNPAAGTTVFTFPPFFGLSVWYQQLAQAMPETSFYCFDFLQQDNRLALYYKQIKKEQSVGPYLLFGYSAGGSLAYEMAAYMEERGEQIAAIILGDSMHVSGMKTDLEKYLGDLSAALATRKDEIANGLLELINHKILRKQSLQRLAAYEAFLNNCKNHSIRADIHLMKAEFEHEIETMHQRWEEYTKGNCKIHQAAGSHDYLFESPNLASNAVLLQSIFETALLAKRSRVS